MPRISVIFETCPPNHMTSEYQGWSRGQISWPQGTCSVCPISIQHRTRHIVNGQQIFVESMWPEWGYHRRPSRLTVCQLLEKWKQETWFLFFSHANTNGCWFVTRAWKVPTGVISALWPDPWSVNFSFRWPMPLYNLVGQEEHEPQLRWVPRRGVLSCGVLGECSETWCLHVYLERMSAVLSLVWELWAVPLKY